MSFTDGITLELEVEEFLEASPAHPVDTRVLTLDLNDSITSTEHVNHLLRLFVLLINFIFIRFSWIQIYDRDFVVERTLLSVLSNDLFIIKL